jgi:ferredoxin
MYLPKIRELKEALTSFFTKPYTSEFPRKEFIPAEEYRGKPRYNDEYCVGCGTCAQVCPAGAIDIKDDSAEKKRTFTLSYYSCINCGQCEENCITEKGIRLTNEYSFAALDKQTPQMIEHITKDLVLCELCNKIIAPAAHLRWVMNRLGGKAFAHPDFLLEMQKDFAPLPDVKKKSRIRREDQFLEVCPECRHKIIVEDEFYMSV